jgi:hypothetical protein
MFATIDGVISVTVIALALAVIVISAAQGCLRRYFFLNLYVAVMLLVDGLRYAALYRWGYSSVEYFWAFFLTDALLVACTYRLILSFFEVVFRDTPVAGYVRKVLLFFVIIIGLMSYSMISRTLPSFRSHLIVEFLQNMYFAAVLLAVLCWIALQHLRVHDRQLGFLIAGLGLSLGVQTAACALQNLLPQETFHNWDPLLARLSTLTTVVKLGLWCYALGWISEEVLAERRQYVSAEAEAGSGG